MEKPRVLLADDNDATCTLIVALLRNEFTVDAVSDGQEAIEKLKSRQYEAILIDLLMPVLDGYGVLDYLQRENPETLARVLVVTASVSTRTSERVSRYGVCKLIAKPFDIELLQGLVRQCAGVPDDPFPRGQILSGGMLLLLANLLR